jgi:hypothetical protein
MRDLKELGIVFPDVPSVVRTPADDLLIAAFEQRFEVRVPDDLRKFPEGDCRRLSTTLCVPEGRRLLGGQ